MIILHKRHLMANRRFKLLVVKTLKEKTTLIAKYFWFENQHAGDIGLDHIHH
ncbi:hypothetical protein Aeroheme_01457 [Aeromonas sp. DSM 116730]